MVNQLDLRVIRTRKMIKNACLDLMEEKGYESITVKDIAEKAFINRKTFYFHFQDKTFLFNEIIKDSLDLMLANTQYGKITSEETHVSIDLGIEIWHFLRNISKNKRLFSILFNDISNYEVNAQMNSLLQSQIVDNLVDRANYSPMVPKELLSQSITSLIMVALKWWINQSTYSEEEAVQILLRLITTGLIDSVGLHAVEG
ncbi:MAG: TetR/AcrR family transcriptional regulator [Syntrophomonadaceae bacterium]|nr:TetR/AcrR family transcriptional regulator [Syntrophomonadaceae bacterium]MDD3024397.1 TetR/AcrR family transcriptional regulator [Syntrophomonadaceae bacterium]